MSHFPRRHAIRSIKQPTQWCIAQTKKDLRFIGHIKHTHEISDSYLAIWIADPPFQLPTSMISLGRVTCTSNAIKLPSCPWNFIPEVKLQCNWFLKHNFDRALFWAVCCTNSAWFGQRYLQCTDKYNYKLFLKCLSLFQDAQTQYQAICR